MNKAVIEETLVEEVFYCAVCEVYVSESEIECEHDLEQTEFVDIF